MSIYHNINKNKPLLRKYFDELHKDAFKEALTGVKTERTLKYEAEQNKLQKRWNKLACGLKKCKCGRSPVLESNIDCGIDGGPSPITIRGVRITCCCGIKTEIHSNYPGIESQIESLRKAKEEWDSYVQII